MLEEGDLVDLETMLTGVPLRLRAAAVRPTATGEVGLQFLAPPPEARELIQRVINEVAPRT